MTKRLRWWLAAQLDRLPGQCWADLVSWALAWDAGDKRSPWSPQGAMCRSDAAETGTCYCGKLRRAAGELTRDA
jgi:hypothetical protein